MNGFDDIINNSKGQNNKRLSKDEWKEKKQKERSDAYELIDSTVTEMVKDIDSFKVYLDVQSRFDKNSVGNAILIYAQKPNATQLKELKDWKEANVFVTDIKNPIKILEPVEYTTADGNTANTFNVKSVYDISQTKIKLQDKNTTIDERLMLKALLYNAPAEVKTVDKIESGKGVEWNKEENTLYVEKGLDSPRVFFEITEELSRINFGEMPDSKIEDFKCKCASYMICKKMGIDVSEYNFELPSEFGEMDNKTIRAELTSIRSAMEDINTRARECFDEQAKNNKNKEQER